MKFLDYAGVQRLWNAIWNRASEGLVQLQSSGDWVYWTSGTAFEAFYTKSENVNASTAFGSLYRSNLQTLTLPEALTGAGALAVKHAEVNCANNSFPCWAALAGTDATGVTWYAVSGNSLSELCLVTAKVMGTIS